MFIQNIKGFERFCLFSVGTHGTFTHARTLVPRECCLASQNRGWRTETWEVRDRMRRQRLPDLDFAKVKWNKAYRVLLILEFLRREPEQVASMRSLDQYKCRCGLTKEDGISQFIGRFPKLFELCRGPKGVLWCGMTKEAESLMNEQTRLLEEHSDKASEYVTRLLMMSVDKRMSLNKIAKFKDLGLPHDFRTRFVHRYPHLFKLVADKDDVKYLELVSWNPDWAITELEKEAEITGPTHPGPGWLSLPFPLKFPSSHRFARRDCENIEMFQRCSYLSPYADACGHRLKTAEFKKRAVAIMHELLSFSIEKRLLVDQLSCFQQEFIMPQKITRLALKHNGVFYVAARGAVFSVFLTKAYRGSELVEKCPLAIWKDKLQCLIDYRKRKRIPYFRLPEDEEGNDLFGSDFGKNDNIFMEQEQGTAEGLDGLSLLENDDEMDIGELRSTYDMELIPLTDNDDEMDTGELQRLSNPTFRNVYSATSNIVIL